MLSVKFNFNLTCEKFYDFLLKSQKLFVKYIAYKNTTLKHKMWYICDFITWCNFGCDLYDAIKCYYQCNNVMFH